MIYHLVIMLSIVLIVICVAAIRYSFATPARKKVTAIAISSGLLGLVVYFSAIPFFNLVTHFKTPEEVFKFISFEPIQYRVDGKESSMLIYYDKDAYTNVLVRKCGDEYKLTRQNEGYTNVYFEEKGPYIGMNLFGAKGSNEFYFCSGVMFDTNNISVSDSKGSDFQIVSVGMDDIRAYFIYGYVGEITSDYYIMFGDEKLRLAQ